MKRNIGISFLIIFTLSFVIYLLQQDDVTPLDEASHITPEAEANPSSELALHMRAMHEEAKNMRKQLMMEGLVEREAPLDFILKAEPTDPNVKGEDFEAFARYFISKSELLSDSSTTDNYNAMVESCVACHQKFCPGPIKTIKKLYIPSASIE